jgi:putative transcriptional regulator
VPIRIDIDLLLVQRKISSKELADAIHITAANLSILKTGKARAIRLDTLAALCRELDCQPGDLLTYVPGQEDETDSPE